MIKKDISYIDYNGVPRVKTFYFNISMDEIIEMEAGADGGYSDFIKMIIETKDARNLVAEFKKFMLKAVGQKSDDGERFIKTDAIRDEFIQTPAFGSLFLELISNSDAAANFIIGALPREFEAELNKQLNANIPPRPITAQPPSTISGPPSTPPQAFLPPSDTPISH